MKDVIMRFISNEKKKDFKRNFLKQNINELKKRENLQDFFEDEIGNN